MENIFRSYDITLSCFFFNMLRFYFTHKVDEFHLILSNAIDCTVISSDKWIEGLPTRPNSKTSAYVPYQRLQP
jgi:hypothetical protein